uniref:Uncharacterized protein n=1 Tax=Vitis vinifera TaxID=29760 RepID=A5AZ27_VITVI|nr:hypothetical protein VITISV_040838 [Vitis vinifera]
MHPHIYLILPLSADTIRGEHLPRLWPLLRFHLGVLLQRKLRLQSPESPLEHLKIHSLSLLPPGALSPARPLRATPIANQEHSMSRHILTTLFCDSSLSCRIHTTYLKKYHLVPFMTSPQFFYPRVALDFYQSMTTRGVPVPASILFTIDERQGILDARQIAEAFHIPYAPADPTAFRNWAPLSEWVMVCILSRGTSSARIIMRKKLPLGMLLVDVVLRAILFPLQHRVQRRGAILESLFRISEAHMGFPADPHSEYRHHCRESFSLDQWNQVWLHQHSLELPEPREVPPRPLPSISAPSTSAPSEPVPEAASSDAPPVVPPTSEPPITIPDVEYRALLASFQTLTTIQTAIMERMDHFQLRQDQQTLILREIQQHLGLLPPAPPVAVPSTVAVEDPSYPPEEPTT